MSEDPNNPQPVDPPVNTGGGGTTASETEGGEAEAQSVDPPVNTGGGGGS